MSHAKEQRRKGGGLTQRSKGGGLRLSWCVRDHSMEPTSISQRIPQRIPHCVPQRDGMFRGPLFELWVLRVRGLVDCVWRMIERVGTAAHTLRHPVAGASGVLFGGGALVSDVEVANFERVFFDKFAAGFDFVTHQDAEHFIGCCGVGQFDFDHRSVAWVERCFPKFFGVHFA